MARAYVAVGSNIAPLANIPAALRKLTGVARVQAISTFYRTPPLDGRGPSFLNGVVEIETPIPAIELKLRYLRGIEAALGRIRGVDPNGPRTIDLDLVLYDTAVIAEPALVLPDPGIAERAFLALPLFELDPDLRLPGTGRALRDVAREVDATAMVPLTAFTASLRAELLGQPGSGLAPMHRRRIK